MENNDPNPAQQEKPKGLIEWFVRNPIYILLVAIVAILSLWTMNWLFLHLLKPTISERGVFGDQFGAVNALFSGMAFAGIIFSLYLQNRALKDQGISLQKQIESIDKQTEQIDLQREDLKHQKQELELQRDEMRKSREEFERQNFNEVFFSLLRNQQEILPRARVSIKGLNEESFQVEKSENLTGLDLLHSLNQQFLKVFVALSYDEHELWDFQFKSKVDRDINLRAQNRETTSHVAKVKRLVSAFCNTEYQISKDHWILSRQAKSIQRVRLAYSILYQKYNSTLAPYFRHLYHILRFISESKKQALARNDRELISILEPLSISTIHEEYANYAQFLQAQLSPVELTLLFYNSLCYPKLHALTKEFDIFENLEFDDTIGLKGIELEGIRPKSKKDLVKMALEAIDKPV